ncbi:hypothetical protein [Arthrospiribacter ruber]|uniref:Outer membrane protein beta-barrel domain-containing protein n=1 Tax=Arthrospiribacter ruber TaxID=2487934 RepID=A0A951MCS1_9BACT|nr:hypothetical protein [Arthrospiribacter ruber]MBW3467215.1 hypothetical protein [Arthrospiribacter ruber]
MKNLICLCLIIIATYTPLFAQEEEEKKPNNSWDIGLEGMAGFSVGPKVVAFNVGGPSLLLRLNDKFKIGVGAIPSFFYLEGRPTARLGVGPRIDYGNFAFFAPFFHRDITDEWLWSVGLGYKFHRR